MKSLRYIIISTFFLISVLPALPCGSFYTQVSNVLKFHFYQDDDSLTLAKQHANENVKLWQSLTSPAIPSSDITAGVYKATYAQLEKWFNDKNCTNKFIQWINQHNASDLRDFLLLAKELEELRENRVSKWYYPSDKSGFDKSKNEQQKFDNILAACEKHKSGRLADRYALQAIRALLATGDYQSCINYYNSTLSSYPDNNLFKQMAKGYIGGCLFRLGEKERAYQYFAEAGQFNSIINEDADTEYYFAQLAYNNPDSEAFKNRLNYFIGYGDDKRNAQYITLANAALTSPYIKHRGDWLYLKAYIEYVYNDNSAQALQHVRQALANSFSSPEMAKDAKLFEICIRAHRGDTGSYLKDAEWIAESYGDTKSVWFYVIPALLKKDMIQEALLVANYVTACDKWETDKNGKMLNPHRNGAFQLLLTAGAADVIKFKNMLKKPTYGLTEKFRQRVSAMLDDEYLDEIIGTLYLREGNYAMAESYLQKVSVKFQESVNVYSYLDYDPWMFNYFPNNKWDYPIFRFEDDYDYVPPLRPNTSFTPDRLSTPHNAKLNFAKEMTRLQTVMNTASSSEQRALAKLKFAIGRYNSFNSCWALTQYWAGETNHCNYRFFQWRWNGDCIYLEYLLDAPTQLEGIDNWFEQEILTAYNSLKTPESIAQAHLLLRNFKTIARHYPMTQAARFLATHCDNWHHWL